MQQLATRLECSVFVRDGESEPGIEKALRSLVPFSLEEEKVRMETTTARGFSERPILIKRFALAHQRHIRPTLEHLRGIFSEVQRRTIIEQAKSRLDANFRFYLRLDKHALVTEGKIYLTDSGECFHIKVALAAYPRTEDAARGVLEKWLGGGQQDI